MNEQETNYITRLEHELEMRKISHASAQNQAASTIFGGIDPTNLIEWQLDFRKELEEIEHLLRGHIIQRDKDNNEIWTQAKNTDGIIFNEKGVQEMLKIIRMYLNKNLILSNFNEETINQRLDQFSNRLASEIYLNYEEYGLDNEYKQKHFAMIVFNITDMIEAAYNRAFAGGERESLRTARMVTQTDPINKGSFYPSGSGTKSSFSIFKPTTWMNR